MAWEQEYKRLHGVDWQQAYESWLRERGVPFAEIGIYKRIAQRIVADVGEVEITDELVAERHEAARASGQTKAQLDSFKELADAFVAFHEERRAKRDAASSGTRPAPGRRKIESMRAPAPPPTAPDAIDVGPISAPRADAAPAVAPEPQPAAVAAVHAIEAAATSEEPESIDLGPLEETATPGPVDAATVTTPDSIDLGPLEPAEPAAPGPAAESAPAAETADAAVSAPSVVAAAPSDTIDLGDAPGPSAVDAAAPISSPTEAPAVVASSAARLPKSKRVCRSCGSPTHLDFRRTTALRAVAGAAALGLVAALVVGWAGGVGVFLSGVAVIGLAAILVACQRCDECGKQVDGAFLVVAELLEIRDVRRRLGTLTVIGLVGAIGMFILQSQLASAVDPETRLARVQQSVHGTVTHLGADPRYELVAEELGAEGVITDYHTLLLTGDAPPLPAGVTLCGDQPVPFCMRVVLGRYRDSVVVEGYGDGVEHPIVREELPIAAPEDSSASR